ncbi:hypothetical protein E2C01_076119 [Portunus trituberculatus]|uniref:Uncharacterized protein n=1 Tax=Portunus trituberculatus TaxID=210409 RepID=A0A5B7IL73_PORTR|nr:hypothetical protein [Portunus trituberculatus]
MMFWKPRSSSWLGTLE